MTMTETETATATATPTAAGAGPAANPPIFDGHNDTLLSLTRTGRSFFERGEAGHIDLPRAREGGLGGGFCAVFVPDPGVEPPTPGDGQDADDPAAVAARVIRRYRDPAAIPPPMPLEHAQREAFAMIARLFRLEAASDGAAKVVRTAAELRRCLADGVFAMELHLEGAEPIDPGLDALDVLHQAGLRSLGPTWSRPNRFAHGVPFAFPSTADVGPGLTDLGQALVRACNRLRIMIDLSHLNEAGFWDVAALSDAPLVATHSNLHALSPSARNLSARQLDAIKASGGVVGLNFHVGFLRADGEPNPDTPLALMADHLDGLLERLGPHGVALGSDFDGATMPCDLADAAALPRLLDELRGRGYDEATLRALAWENWARVLERTWGA